MASDARHSRPRAPSSASTNGPDEPRPYMPAAAAYVPQSLSARGEATIAVKSGNPADEYKSVCEFMRQYSMMRFYQLALLLGTTGSIVTALSSNAVRTSFAGGNFLKAGGLIVSLALLVMELRATSHWHRLRDRGNELAQLLSFAPFPTSSRWDPLTTSGAGFYLHAAVVSLWLTGLFLRFNPGP
jgi:hypothetical protein